MKAFFKKIWSTVRRNCSIPAIVFYGLAIFSLILHLLCIFIPAFADFFNIYIAGTARFLLAKLTGFLPVSLAELLICLVPLLLIFIVVFSIYHARKEHYTLLTRFFCGAFAIVSLFYSLFVFTLGTGYHGSALETKLNLDRKELTTKQLEEVASWLAEELNKCLPQVQFMNDSSSVMPYDFDELNEKLNIAYKQISEKYDFIMGFSSRVKPVMNSDMMSKAGLLGMYTYYTGESNVNVDYNDYNLVFTCAHEMAHQRGLSKEDEANFVAFLVCLESDDPYINYCGYLNMFEYMLNPLYKALKEEENTAEYYSVLRKADERARIDIGVSSKKTAENQSGLIYKISNTANDAYIKINGDENGSASYGLVIELAAAYYYNLKGQTA